MGSSIGFYCTNQDRLILERFTDSIGLKLLPPKIDIKLKAAEDGAFCYLSLVDIDQVHPYGDPPTKISYAKDPVMIYMRGYLKDPYLVLGQIQWSDSVPHLAQETKPSYQKVVRWIKKQWANEGDFYFGPEARELVDSGKVTTIGVFPGQVNLEVIKV